MFQISEIERRFQRYLEHNFKLLSMSVVKKKVIIKE